MTGIPSSDITGTPTTKDVSESATGTMGRTPLHVEAPWPAPGSLAILRVWTSKQGFKQTNSMKIVRSVKHVLPTLAH